MTCLQLFKRQFYRESLIYIRQPRLIINAWLFFIMIMVFFPLTIPAQSTLLKELTPGLIWIGILLAFLLSSERLFQQDYDEGIIEQWLSSGYSLTVIVGAKLSAHWLISVLPLVLFCPVLGLFFGLSWEQIVILILSIIVATPAILSLCGLAAAFTTGMQQKGIFMALILLPLTVPIMILASGTLTLAIQGLPVSAYLALSIALSLAAASLIPIAIAAIIRIALSN